MNKEQKQSVIENIMTRRSIRNFTGQSIIPDDLHTILAAGMSGPSCADVRDWSFIIVTNKEMLGKMADANGRYADPLRNAAMGILVCGDLQRAFKGAEDYWIIDCSIAAQNMILCAHSLGIGSVWLGTWPQMERVKEQAKLFKLPEHIIPHSVLAFGYPAEKEQRNVKDFDDSRIHMEQW
ncbi:MAG: nitroreductase family protein [Lachnospiraceae bacterium]|nr:nitroreductase family protein [Lachnospiraceae bacterium]